MEQGEGVVVRRFFGVMAICAWAGAAAAQNGAAAEVRAPGPYPPGQALENPMEPSEASLAEGRRVFQSQCAMCHGADGAGEPAMQGELTAAIPDLTDGEWLYGASDGEIFTLIQSGTPNEMQGFAGKLNDRQIWNIVNYIRSLEPADSDGPESLENPVEKTTQSLLAGRQNYARFCVECHGLDGRGHTEMNEFLLTRPADLTRDDWTYGTEDGVVFHIIKNGTPNDMPAFADRFDDEAIWNIVNYLESLRK